MKEHLDEVEGWMEQVRDDDLSVEDYGFLDRVSHGGSDGNNGLANVGTHLAVHEEDGELIIDRELLDELDRRQEQGSSRHSNIAFRGETKKRDGNTLKDRYREGDRQLGHSLLQDMVDGFRENGDLEAETPQEANTTTVEDYESKGPLKFKLDTSNTRDSNMTDKKEESYGTLRKLDTAGGYVLAGATGLINVPVTALGMGAKYLEGDEEEQAKGTEIPVTEEETEDVPGNDTISSKPETESESYGGDNSMPTEQEMEEAAARRTEAVAEVSEILAGHGATVDDAVEAAYEAENAYREAKGDLDDAHETLKATHDQDTEFFRYASRGLAELDRTLQHEVVDILSNMDHDSYDLEDVKREIDDAGYIWDENLPDDPSDLTSY